MRMSHPNRSRVEVAVLSLKQSAPPPIALSIAAARRVPRGFHRKWSDHLEWFNQLMSECVRLYAATTRRRRRAIVTFDKSFRRQALASGRARRSANEVMRSRLNTGDLVRASNEMVKRRRCVGG